MIKYNLICKNCNLNFDSWFGSSNEYEKLKKKNFLRCHNCDSKKVDKSLMAPKMINNCKIQNDKKDIKKYKEFRNKIIEYQKFIKNNFKYVGENFAYEARSIHYNEKKKEKGIYGTATKSEIKELKDEGIETDLIPWVDDAKN